MVQVQRPYEGGLQGREVFWSDLVQIICDLSVEMGGNKGQE